MRAAVQTAEEASHLKLLPNADKLHVVHGCDLDMPGSYDKAFNGAVGVIHTAAKVALGASQSIVDISVTGTKNVLNSVDANPSVTNYCHTSSCAAIQRYDVDLEHVFTEEDWNDWSTLKRGDGYGVAKTAAERVVHSHFADPLDTRHSAAVNPNVAIGPVMTKQHSVASVLMLRDVIFGNKTMYFPASFVDVRDVAIGHVEALIRPEARKKRFILVGDADPCDQRELARVAADIFPEWKFSAPARVHPSIVANLLVPLSHLPFVGGKIMSEFEREVSNLRRHYRYDNSEARTVLGVDFRPLQVSVEDGVKSMVEQGFAKPRARSA